MNKLNKIFTLSSLSVLLVTIERFSFTGKILLPFGFLRLHELIQMALIILITVILPVFLLKEATNNFESLKLKNGFLLFLAFIIGIYFYSTGNGVHELGSFYLNSYCDTNFLSGNLCSTFFINDYYTGNILYFFGGILMVVPLMLFEKLKPNIEFKKKDMKIAAVNALVYSLAIFAYAGFDKVLVGLIFSLIVSLFAISLFWQIRKKYIQYPIITYTTITYLSGTILALIARIIH